MLAHELSHIKHRDTLTMTITATMAGAISMLANFAMFAGMFGGGNNRNNPLGFVGVILVSILAPIAAVIVQMAISRTREFEADREGAEISGPAAVARLGAEAHRSRRRGNRKRGRRRPSGDRAYVHHQSAAWRLLRAVCEPSLDRRARRPAPGHGRTDGTGRAATEPVGVSGTPAGLAAREAAQAILGEVLRKRRPLDAALDMRLGRGRAAAARRRICARHRRRDPAPLRPTRRA